MFTVWYIYTPVACDSRYTLSTVRKCLKLRLIDRHHNFASIFLVFEKCSYFTHFFRRHCYLRHNDCVCHWNLLKWSLS